MRFRVFVTAAVIRLASACGGTTTSGAFTPLPDLTPSLVGTWRGATAFTFDGEQQSSYSAALTVSVSGQHALVRAVCPDGSGVVDVAGTDASANGGVSVTCLPVASVGCPAVVFTYESFLVRLNGSSVTVYGMGAASGCGTSQRGFVSTFTGTK